MAYREKTSEFFSQDFSNLIVLDLHSKSEIDRVRVSFSYANLLTNAVESPGMLVWSSINNDYIGTIGTNVVSHAAGNITTQDTHEPVNGIDIFFGKKFILNGSYNFKFYYLNGNIVNNADITNGIVNILVEYFKDV